MSNPISKRLGSTITLMLVGAAFVGVALLLPGVPEVKAEPQAGVASHQAYPKGDRLPLLAKGAACSTLGWPNYEQGCLFDKSQPADAMRTVRVIALR